MEQRKFFKSTPIWTVLVVLMFAALGTRIQHWLIIRGSHDLIHGDMGDSRFVNLLLEHAWSYISGIQFLAKGYWDAPWNFYPAPKTLLMSEVMGGSAWSYILFRFFGWSANSAYQLWFISTSILNFLSAFFMARTLGLKTLGSLAAAWIFAFGLVRGAFIAHPQLMPHYFSAISVAMGFLAFRYREEWFKSMAYGLLSGLSLGLQFWASFYLVWFSVLTILLSLLLSIFIWKSITVKKLWEHRLSIAALGVGFLASAGGLAVKYLSMQAVLGGRQWSDVVGFLPKFRALFLPSPEAWLYHWLFQKNYDVSGWYSEMFMFPGFFGFLVVFLSLWRLKVLKQLGIAEFCALLWLVMMIVTQHDLWKMIYYLVPGAGAVRAVGRISLAALLPMGLTVGGFIDRLSTSRLSGRKSIVFGTFLLILVILDNGVSPNYGYSAKESNIRVEVIQAAMHARGCKVFHFAAQDTPWKIEIDSMWASMTMNVPTMNGYSGNLPVGYKEAGMASGMDVNLATARRWLERHPVSLNDEEICILKIEPKGA